MMFCALLIASPAQPASVESIGRKVLCGPGMSWLLPPAPSSVRAQVRSDAEGPCPSGQVPSPVGRPGLKGSPGRLWREATSTGATVTYHYAGVFEFAVVVGAAAEWAQFQPAVSAADHHSLAELSVESADGMQIVEVGWTVDPELNGDALPHLFVFHWVDGQAGCYNGCGWQQVSRTRYPGMVVAPTLEPQQVIYRYFNSAWWVWYQAEWIGFFPGSLWNVDFASAGLVQWFGEVAGIAEPKSQMGDGLLPSQANAAFMSDLQLETATGESQTASVSPSTVTDPGAYQLSVTDAGFHFGGPGYNSEAECNTCASLLANCGMVEDGCGNVLACGTCLSPETCGQAGQPNVCVLPDGGMGGEPWPGSYYSDGGTADGGAVDAGSTLTGNSSGGSGCSSSGAGVSLVLAALALGLLAPRRRASR
jgi:uncharacterized protein (TIGR03382 family)